MQMKLFALRKRRLVALMATVALASGVVAATTGANAGAAAKPKSGGSLTYLFAGASPSSFDPALTGTATRWTAAAQYLSAVYGMLVYEDFKTDEVKPWMAESLTATDAANWVLKLREGVTFSNGKPFDAAAVKANWENIPNVPATTLRSAVANIAALNVVDARTLNISLKEPNSAFDRAVATTLTFIAEPSTLPDPAIARSAVGAGPFTLQSMSTDGTAVFKKNPKYWDAPRPYLDELTIQFIADNGQRFTSFQAGSGQLINLMPNQIQQSKDAGFPVTTISPPGGGLLYLFNTTRPPFNDVEVRRGVAYAVNAAAMNEALQFDNAIERRTMFDKKSPFYVKNATWEKYNPKKAQAAFDAYTARTGQPVEILFTAATQASDVVNYMAAQFAEYDNVTFTPNLVQASAYGLTLFQGNFGMAPFAWGASDPAGTLTNFFLSTSTPNFGKYNNPEVDRLLREAAATTDQAVRIKNFAEVQRIVTRQDAVAFSPLTAPNYVSAVKDVQGLKEYGGDGLWLWDRVWLKRS
jgi:peptide/nickel transport system substrate-binding protein